MSQRKKQRREPEAKTALDSAGREQTEGAIPSERQVPVWVYIVLLLFVVALLLGVEAFLDWLLPIPAR